MGCAVCTSGNQAEFPTEIAVHLPGLKNLAKPSVLVFPKLLICLDCGFSSFMVPETELRLLKDASAESNAA